MSTENAGNSRDAATVAERYAAFLSELTLESVPPHIVDVATRDLIDAVGLCIAARNTFRK